VTLDVRHSDPICHRRAVHSETIEQLERINAAVMIEYDTVKDLLHIEFLADVPIKDSRLVDGVVIDYAKDKRIVAIEVLDAGKRTTRGPLDLIDLAIVRARSCTVATEKRPRKKTAKFHWRRPLNDRSP
jgi:uncharacterized protein YuzE